MNVKETMLNITKSIGNFETKWINITNETNPSLAFQLSEIEPFLRSLQAVPHTDIAREKGLAMLWRCGTVQSLEFLWKSLRCLKTKLLLVPVGAWHCLRSLLLLIADREGIKRPKAKCFQGFCTRNNVIFVTFRTMSDRIHVSLETTEYHGVAMHYRGIPTSSRNNHYFYRR